MIFKVHDGTQLLTYRSSIEYENWTLWNKIKHEETQLIIWINYKGFGVDRGIKPKSTIPLDFLGFWKL